MQYGTVTRFFPEKGYGFIRPDQGPDVFFHISMIGACQPLATVEVGQAVKFELESRAERERRTAAASQSRDTSGPVQLRATMVELIDRIPGRKLEDEKPPQPHKRARRKKPTWRR